MAGVSLTQFQHLPLWSAREHDIKQDAQKGPDKGWEQKGNGRPQPASCFLPDGQAGS